MTDFTYGPYDVPTAMLHQNLTLNPKPNAAPKLDGLTPKIFSRPVTKVTAVPWRPILPVPHLKGLRAMGFRV